MENARYPQKLNLDWRVLYGIGGSASRTVGFLRRCARGTSEDGLSAKSRSSSSGNVRDEIQSESAAVESSLSLTDATPAVPQTGVVEPQHRLDRLAAAVLTQELPSYQARAGVIAAPLQESSSTSSSSSSTSGRSAASSTSDPLPFGAGLTRLVIGTTDFVAIDSASEERLLKLLPGGTRMRNSQVTAVLGVSASASESSMSFSGAAASAGTCNSSTSSYVEAAGELARGASKRCEEDELIEIDDYEGDPSVRLWLLLAAPGAVFLSLSLT